MRLQAQTTSELDLFKTGEPANLTAQAAEIVAKLQASDAFEFVLPVTLRSVSQVIQHNRGELKVTFPTSPTTYRIKTDKFEMRATGDYVWAGSFKSQEGSAVLISKAGEVFGSFNVKGKAYELHSLGNGLNALALKKPFPTALECSMVNLAPIDTTPPTIEIPDIYLPELVESPEGACNDEDVRILFLYTILADTRMSDPEHTALISTAILNQALERSKTNFKVSMAGVEPLFGFHESNNIVEDVTTDLPNDPTAQSLRDDYEADLVVLFTNGLTGNYPFYAGRVAELGPVESKAYGIVQVNYANTVVFPHEVGHLFGCRHQRGVDTRPDDPFQHAHDFLAFKTKKRRRTILWTPYNPNEQVPHFSNPNVMFGGAPTGTPTRYNALKLQESFPIVKNFRPYLGPTVSIQGPSWGWNTQTRTWDAAYCIDPSLGEPVSYLWEYSLYGSVYTTAGTGSSLTMAMPADSHLYLRLTITFSGGVTGTGFKFIYNRSLDDLNPYGRKAAPSRAEKKLAYPNPVADKLTLNYQMAVSGEIKATLQGLDHHNFKNAYTLLDKKSTKGIYTEHVSLRAIPDGTYLLTLITPSETIT